MPEGVALRSTSRASERVRASFSIATEKIRCPVGTVSIPSSTARLADASIRWKSRVRLSPPPRAIATSTRFASSGPRNPLASREPRISTLNSAKLIAIRRVRTPAIRAA